MLEEWKSKVYHAKQTEGKLPLNWGKIREKRLKKDNYTCQRCGRQDQLTVHHILPRAEGGRNNQGNLITLCNPCHDEVEELGLRSRILIANWRQDSEAIEDNRPISDSKDWHTWVYGGMRRNAPSFSLVVSLPKEEKPTEEMLIQWSELRRQIEPAEPKVLLPVKQPEAKAIELPKAKAVKPVKAKRVYRKPDPKDLFIVRDSPVDPNFVAEMYEHYTRRDTPSYIYEIFERWLTLKTTQEWAAKNGRILPDVPIAKSQDSVLGNAL